MTIGESHTEPTAPETDAAAAARRERAIRIAAEPEGVAQRGPTMRVSIAVGVLGVVFSIVVFVLDLLSPTTLRLPVVEGIRGAVAPVVGSACVVLALWLGLSGRSRGSVLTPLDREERRSVRRAYSRREAVEPEWRTVVSAYGGERRNEAAATLAFAGGFAVVASSLHWDDLSTRSQLDVALAIGLALVFSVIAVTQLARSRSRTSLWS